MPLFLLPHVKELHNVQGEQRVLLIKGVDQFVDDFCNDISWQVVFAQESCGLQGARFCLFLEHRVRHQGFLQLHTTFRLSQTFERLLIFIKILSYIVYYLFKGIGLGLGFLGAEISQKRKLFGVLRVRIPSSSLKFHYLFPLEFKIFHQDFSFFQDVQLLQI